MHSKTQITERINLPNGFILKYPALKAVAYLCVAVLIIFFNSCNAENKKQSSSAENHHSDSSDSAVSFITEVIADNLYVPWSIIFTDTDRMLFTERNGRLRIIYKEKLVEKPLHVFKDVSSKGEEGLMGLAPDPDYASNKKIYMSYAYDNGDELKVKVVRFRDAGDSLTDGLTILDNLPAERYHAGCRLKFGPDGKLYITTGDAGSKEKVQDINSLYGKILRINPDGTIPADNPFPNNPVWSFGHRNPQGIDWYPGTDILYSTEHGPSGFDGPGGGDEVNIIFKGENYGWPVVSHERSKEGMISPELVFTPAIAPASGMFYKSKVIPEFQNNFFFGCLRGSCIMRVIIDSDNPRKIVSFKKLNGIDFGRIRDITEGPDGAIYFSTSNRDGRGNIREGDDKIIKLKKK